MASDEKTKLIEAIERAAAVTRAAEELGEEIAEERAFTPPEEME